MKLNCKRIDFAYTPGEEIFTFPEESGLPFLFDAAEELAEKAKAAIQGALADEGNPYHGTMTYFMRFHRDEVPPDIAAELFPGTDLSQLSFAGMEAELRRMMDEDKDHTRGAELVAQMVEALNLVFDEISFEMGFNGEKHELILTPEGEKVKLFELVYFQKHAPREVLEHWNILVGRQPSPNTGLRTEDGWDISGKDVQIWLEEALAAGDGPEILTLTGVFTGFVLLSRGGQGAVHPGHAGKVGHPRGGIRRRRGEGR